MGPSLTLVLLHIIYYIHLITETEFALPQTAEKPNLKLVKSMG